MSNLRYKIFNVTKKPGVTKGKHLRGFLISVDKTLIHPNQFAIVTEISEGLLAFQKKGWIKIDPIEDHIVTLKEETKKQEEINQKIKDESLLKLKEEAKQKSKLEEIQIDKQIQKIEKETSEAEPSSSIDKDKIKQQLKEEMSNSKTTIGEVAEEDDTLDNSSFVVTAKRKNGSFGQKNK